MPDVALANILGQGYRRWNVVSAGGILAPGQPVLYDGSNSSDDPSWAQVASILSFDSDLTDDAGNAWTQENNFTSSNLRARFGTASGRWAASNSLASTPSATKFNMPGDFCIDFWFFRPSGLTTASNFIARGGGASNSEWVIYFGTDGNFRWFTGNTELLLSGATATDTWVPMRINRSGSTLSWYVNGTRTGTVTDNRNYTNTNALTLGFPGSLNPGTCHIDEFRLTVGAARETGASYTVATSAFPRLGATGNFTFPAVLEPGDWFLAQCAVATVRLDPGAGRRIGANAVGAVTTLTPGQRGWLVARSATQLDIIP